MDKIKIGKLNLFDIIVIAIVLLCIIFMVIKFWPQNSDSNITEQNNKFSYVVRVEGISATSADMIKVGDELFDKVSNSKIGIITNLKVEPAVGVIEGIEGTIIQAEMPNKIDVDITVETEGKMQNGEYVANGLIRILVGQTKQVKTKYWMASGFVTEVNS